MYKDEKRFLIGCAVFMLVVLAGIGITTYMNDVKGTSYQNPADRIEIADPWGHFDTQTLGDIIRHEVRLQNALTHAEHQSYINDLQERDRATNRKIDINNGNVHAEIDQIENRLEAAGIK